MILDLQCNVMNRMKDDRKLESSEQQNNNTKKENDKLYFKYIQRNSIRPHTHAIEQIPILMRLKINLDFILYIRLSELSVSE